MNASSDTNQTALGSGGSGVGSWHENWQPPNIRIGANEAIFMALGYSLGSFATAVCFMCGTRCKRKKRRDSDDDEDDENDENRSNIT